MTFTTTSIRARSCVRPLAAVALTGALAILGWSGTASAAPCMADAAGDASLNCTANDFAVSAITVTNVIDGCDSIGDTFVFDAEFHIGAGSTSRYDIGFYVGSDGVQAYTGSCFVTTIPVNGSFPDLDQDQCADYEGLAFVVPVPAFTSACVDTDNDGFFDVAICESWDNNAETTCNGPADAIPGNAAKCNCQRVNTDIAIPNCTSNADCVTDRNPCTDEVCNSPESGLGDAFGCSHDNNTLPCEDGLFCTDVDTCAAGTCAGTARDCGDGNVCTDDSCDETADSCSNAANTTPCDDGLFCTDGDVCSGGSCSGPPRDCSDGNVCTADSCDDEADACVATDNTATCDDGLFCTVGDTCAGGVCNGPERDCNDANVCTDDACNEDADACALTPNTAPCDDAAFCNGTDTCRAGICGHDGDPCPGADGDGDCAETCDEAANDCNGADINGSTCDDGLFCNGGPDMCAAGVCSDHPGSPCDDDESCTADSCDEELDDCSSVPVVDGTACDDEDLCTLEDGCADGLCVGHETALMDLCPWIIVERQGPKRDTLKVGTRSDIGGDICGGLVRVRNGTIVDGDLASGSTTGPRQIRLTYDAFIDEDVVSAGAGVKASPGVANLPQLSFPISSLVPGSLTGKIDGVHFYDLTGAHPLADDCVDARNVMPDVMALLDGLPSNDSFPKIKLKSFQSLKITAKNPGSINVVDVAQLRTGRNVSIELDGGGNPDTVLVLRVAQKFMMKLQSTLTLTGGLRAENTLVYVKGKQCKIGDLIDGAGTVLCSNGRLKTGRTITWLGTFYGAGKILKIGDTNVLTYSPFRGF